MIDTPLRFRQNISNGWEFVRGRVSRHWLAGRGDPGETVNLPHCWNRDDTFQFDRQSYSGHGAYRRVVNLPHPPAVSGAWRVRSEGFFGVGEVWLDGRTIARFDAQYLGFDVGLTVGLPAGQHQLAVRLDNLWRRNVLPGTREPDFLLHGGLAGRVWVEWLPELHLDPRRLAVECTTVTDVEEATQLRCGINGLESSPENLRLSWSVTDPDGVQIAAVEQLRVTEPASVVSTTITRPRCWSPTDPRLYWGEARLETDNGIKDTVRIRFGVTRAEFRPDEGFFLDGERTDLHGWNRHAAIPGLGNALPEEIHRADAQLFKDYGCNFVRLSHYPQHPTFLDACDELGIMVYAEIASWKSVRSSRGWRRAARRQLRELILRDRHHPSVILWGMGNESRSRKAYLEMREIARSLDPARPVTYAENHLYRARRKKTLGIPDVWSVNYELDVLPEARDAARLRNVVLSECCNHSNSVKGNDREELVQIGTLEREWEIMAGKPYLAGHAVWGFTDYATEHRQRYRRLNGLFDAWRRPKMAAELFRARFADEPFISLFITGDDGHGQLQVFSNCELVRLTRDDTPPIVLSGALHHTVSLEDGFTVVRAKGVRGGVTVRNELRAWDEAATVKISIDHGEVAPGRTVPVDLSIRDNADTPVRDWNGHIRVAADGEARIFPYTDAGEVLMARGEGRAYLELPPSGGEVVVNTEAQGLTPGTATIHVGSE
jgi:beta-galactosidase